MSLRRMHTGCSCSLALYGLRGKRAILPEDFGYFHRKVLQAPIVQWAQSACFAKNIYPTRHISQQPQGQQNNWYPSTRHTITKNSVVSVFGRNSISAMPPPKQNSIRPQILFIACASPFMLSLQSMRDGVQSLIFSPTSLHPSVRRR